MLSNQEKLTNVDIARIVYECKKEVQAQFPVGKKRKTVIVNMKNGEQWTYRCRAVNHDSMIGEVLTFIRTLELATGETVYWYFADEPQRGFISTNYREPSKKSKLYSLVCRICGLPEDEEEE